ncbi:MAG: MoaD/ThiS family protein [Euryarchaeota archaeon]|nr:MoaD/ThiS family protein [Euryarchaeota archaeon]
MKITIKLIGRYKDITGKQELLFDILSGDTLWHAVDEFIKRYPVFEKDKQFMIVTKNNMFTNLNEKIKEGDNLTIAPPVVSGG